MKNATLLIILLLSLTSEIFGQTPTWLWAKSGDSKSNSYANGLVTDSTGNIYITGYFTGDSITFGNFTLFNSKKTSSSDLYIVKYDPNGKVLWATKSIGNKAEISNSITIDKSGYIYVAGYFDSDSLKFGNIILTNSMKHPTIFIAKFDLNGKAIWAKKAGGNDNDRAKSIAASSDGNIYVTGFFCSLNLILGKDTLIKKGSADAFVAKFDSSGNVIWAKSAKYSNGNSIATDRNNNAYVIGYFYDSTVTFGKYILTNASIGLDIFTVKYNPAGNVIWAKSAGGDDVDDGLAITTDKFSNIYIGGYFLSPKITFGNKKYNNQGNRNLFLVKYDSMGNIIWVNTTGGRNDAATYGITTDTTGNIYITGYFTSPIIKFGNFTLTNYSLLSRQDLFVTKYDSSGNIKWAISAYGKGTEQSNSINIDLFQNIYITGQYQNSEIGFCKNKLDSTGSWDVFVAKLVYCTLPKPIISIIGDTTFCQGDSVILTSSSAYGNLWSDSSLKTSLNIKKSGVYYVKVTDSFCCSFTSANVTITVLPKPTTPAITQSGDTTFCLGDSVILTSSIAFAYQWSDSSQNKSVTVKNSGNYSVTVSDSFGCKASSQQVNVTVFPAPVGGFNINQTPQTLIGNNFIFTNISSSPSGSTLNHLWDFGDGITSILTSPSHTYTTFGTFDIKLVVTNAEGCKDSITKQVVVLSGITVTVDFTVSSFCVGDTVYFKNNSTITPPDIFLNFLWDFGDGSTIIRKEPKHIYTTAGKYIINLVALTAFGFKDTLIDTIEIFTDPIVTITASPNTIVIPGNPVTLTTIGLYDQLLWYNNSTTNTVIVTTEGKYWVTASYNNGCKSSDTIFLIKGEISVPDVVNVITPNGDGINDMLVIKNIDLIKPCKLSIYNRWGDELFSNSDYQNNWEGIYKGKILPEGTYYYALETKDGKVYKGAVNILK
jgi:gliding motility-associated-like protein